MMDVLGKILAHKRTEIAALEGRSLRRAEEYSPPPRDLLSAIRRHRFGHRPSLIAELKRASPSKGILAPHLDLFELADVYAQNGASALSVLTDNKFFMGALETLRALRFTRQTELPLLRKDFILDEVQLYETRANGADAVLLIAAALPDDAHFADLHTLALELGLIPLVEVHNKGELERALTLQDVKLIGINNRDLTTFDVSLETTDRLRPLIPDGIPVVAESGIFSAEDVERLASAEVDAILVGEALVTAEDIAAKVRELSGHLAPLSPGEPPAGMIRGGGKGGRVMTKIKICGLKTLPDALAAIRAGADYLGFNFYPKSVRFIEVDACAEITSVLKQDHPEIGLVGVFVNSPVDEIKTIMKTCRLDLAQLHGDETPEILDALGGKGFKAFRGVPETLNGFTRAEAPALLVDASVKGAYGGTGIVADWPAAAELAKRYPLFLAGGLTPENVADAVRRVKPWGVDTASGVEAVPGEKDAMKMKEFVQAVRRLETGKSPVSSLPF